MSWDTRIVQIKVRVSVHHESGVDQDKLVDWVTQEACNAVADMLRDAEDDGLLDDGIEVELT